MTDHYNLAIPVNIPISGFGLGRLPDCDADRFTINLKTASDIALHFDVRLDDRCVVRNNTRYSKWQSEERYGDFPFLHGQNFTLEFIAMGGEIHVLYDGRLLTRFVERDDPLNIRTVNIEGDVDIHSVHISN